MGHWNYSISFKQKFDDSSSDSKDPPEGPSEPQNLGCLEEVLEILENYINVLREITSQKYLV